MVSYCLVFFLYQTKAVFDMKSDFQTAAQHHLHNISTRLQSNQNPPPGANPQDFRKLHNLTSLIVRAYHDAIEKGLRPTSSDVSKLRSYEQSINRSTGTAFADQLDELVDFIKRKIPGVLNLIS